MTNAVYRTTVEALEAVMSPRAVSRSLQEGLTSLGKTPATVSVEDVEGILKGQVFRLLQATMPAVAAKETVRKLLDKLEPLRATAGAAAVDLSEQGRALDELQRGLKAFNLYFEWPETQKLRTQVGLLKADHEAGRAADALVRDARAGLGALERKLEDHLVAQARELGELEAGLESVKTLEGPKVRRLESLIGQIGRAQEARELAPAEGERARKLVTDLRKLAGTGAAPNPPPPEAGLLDVKGGAPPTADVHAAQADPKGDPAGRLDERLRRIDAENELHKLEALTREFGELFAHQPAWAEEVARRRALVGGADDPEVGALSSLLTDAQEALREALTREFGALQAALGAGDGELGRALRVVLGVLKTALPSLADVQRVRSLAKVLEAQAQEHARELEAAQAEFEAKLRAQGEALGRFREALARHQNVPAAAAEHRALHEAVTRLAATQAQGRVAADDLNAAQTAEAALEARVARSTQTSPLERERAQVRALLSRLQVLPLLPTSEGAAGALKGEFEALIQRDAIGPEEVQRAQARAARFEAALKAAYDKHLGALFKRAGALGDPALTGRLEAERAALESHSDYPDLHALERALQAAFENRRAAMLGELHALEGELEPYRALGPELTGDLSGLLQETRKNVEEGALTEALAPLRARLEALQDEVEKRLGGFETRLSAALVAFEPVSRLNSDETATVKRTLHHLDTQRDAFHRVSLSVRLELEASLREAEALIEGLQAQLEATRAVADFLVSDGLFDDILGVFGDPQEPHAPPGGGDALEKLLETYLRRPEVRAAAVLSTQGKLVGGRLDLPLEALHKALGGAEGGANTVGQGRHTGDTAPLILEAQGHPVIAAWPTEGYRVVFVLTSLGSASAVVARLGTDMEAFGTILRGPTFA